MPVDNTISYFDLPGEVRNQIIAEIFVPGHVYVRSEAPNGWSWKHHCVSDTVLDILALIYTFVAVLVMKLRLLHLPADHFEMFSPECIPKGKTRAPAKHPAYQLLATCRQSHLEGHHIFYSENIFHIPPGPLEEAIGWEQNLQDKHRVLIRRVYMDLNLSDLTPKVLADIQCEIYT